MHREFLWGKMKFSWIVFYYRIIVKRIADFIPTPPQHFLHDQWHWWERKSALLRLTGMHIDPHVVIDSGFFVLTLCEQNVTIKARTAIGRGFSCFAFNKITIGRFCMFAANVKLTNGGHDTSTLVPFSGPLAIGSGCWIGDGAHICGPVTVGDNSIVAAGSLVIDDVPPAAIVAGVPAKIVGYRTLPAKVWHLGNTWFCPFKFELVD